MLDIMYSQNNSNKQHVLYKTSRLLIGLYSLNKCLTTHHSNRFTSSPLSRRSSGGISPDKYLVYLPTTARLEGGRDEHIYNIDYNHNKLSVAIVSLDNGDRETIKKERS